MLIFDSRTVRPQRPGRGRVRSKAFGWDCGAEPEMPEPLAWPLPSRPQLDLAILPSRQGRFVSEALEEAFRTVPWAARRNPICPSAFVHGHCLSASDGSSAERRVTAGNSLSRPLDTTGEGPLALLFLRLRSRDGAASLKGGTHENRGQYGGRKPDADEQFPFADVCPKRRCATRKPGGSARGGAVDGGGAGSLGGRIPRD